MIRPPYLKAGDTIGIVAPARSISEAEIAPFVSFIKAAGYKIRLGARLFGKKDQYSGTLEERLEDLHAMIADREVRVVFAARGGYGSAQLLPRLDAGLLRNNPKWLVGFSDMTALHSAINGYIESMHAVMPYSLAMEEPQDAASFESMMEALKGEPLEYNIPPNQFNYHGEASGILCGGNLSVLYSLAGTPFEPDYEAKILFLEDLDEYLYHIDRMLLNFEQRNIFKKIAGLVVGDMSGMHDNTIPFGKNALEIIAERAHKYRVPSMFGFPAGHKKSNYTLIFGRLTTLKINDRGSSIVQ